MSVARLAVPGMPSMGLPTEVGSSWQCEVEAPRPVPPPFKPKKSPVHCKMKVFLPKNVTNID